MDVSITEDEYAELLRYRDERGRRAERQRERREMATRPSSSSAVTVGITIRASELRATRDEDGLEVEPRRVLEVLRAMGVGAEAAPSASGRTWLVTLSLPTDSPREAEAARTRRAGRRRAPLSLPAGSELSADMPCADFLAWRESHKAEECMAQLGMRPGTYYKRLRLIEAWAAWDGLHGTSTAISDAVRRAPDPTR